MTATLPDAVQGQVERLLNEGSGSPGRVVDTVPLGGGCINPSVRLTMEDGSRYFLKWNDGVPDDFFAVEARGLQRLAEPATLRVPAVVGVSDPGATIGWLLLEFVERGGPGAGYGHALGEGLARLHAATRGPEHGGADNYIGPLPQGGAPCVSWPEFWWRRRLAPQIERARNGGFLSGLDARLARLAAELPRLLAAAEEDGMSLLHGDLWSGNVFPGPDGEPVLVDPSVYRGHREVDLAMTELFGGFDTAFYDRYDEVMPRMPGYETRRDVYQLYPLLVHVNLFGAGYESGVRATLDRLLS